MLQELEMKLKFELCPASKAFQFKNPLAFKFVKSKAASSRFGHIISLDFFCDKAK